MRFKKLTFAIFGLTLSIVTGITLFPPWATVMGGNGYPRISFRWILSPPQPLGEFAYRVDVIRLQTRYAIVLLAFIATLILIRCIRKSRNP